MSIHYQRDGSVLFVSDTDPSVKQLQSAGKTQLQIDAAYAAFIRANPLPTPPPNPVAELAANVRVIANDIMALHASVAACCAVLNLAAPPNTTWSVALNADLAALITLGG